MSAISGVNDFVLRFANVNGSGSASANSMVAKSFFRMGLPIGPKNMFPSNIQGYPTWYEIRVNEKGYTGRRGGVDFMVAMNPQTFAKDTEAVSTGGYLLYDSTRFLPEAAKRKDITYIPVPLTEMCLEKFTNPKSRAMLKNIVYVGVLAALLDIDYDVLKTLIQDLYGKKPKILESNFVALELGYSYTKKNFQCPLPLKVAKRDIVKDKILLEGNAAAGLGAVYAGATVCAWYPITPSTSVIDSFTKYCNKYRVDPETGKKKFAIIQAEDELSAIGMVLGANWNGSRAFTATSGPGVSLMTEFLGYAYYAEIPAVLFNIQRVGPATGMPTRTAQADLISCAYASHGDTKHLLLFPATANECFEFSHKAFDAADRFQTPVIVMSDLELGMNEWLSDPLTWDDNFTPDRGKVLDEHALDTRDKPFFRYLDEDGDGVPYRTLPGTHPTKAAYFTRGSGHDKYGRYTEDGDLFQENLDRIVRKFETAESYLPAPVIRHRDPKAKVGVICIGTTEEPLHEALDLIAAEGHVVNDMRIRAFPFSKEVQDFMDSHEKIVVVDQNRDAQLRSLLILEFDYNPKKLLSVTNYDGLPATAFALAKRIKEKMMG